MTKGLNVKSRVFKTFLFSIVGIMMFSSISFGNGLGEEVGEVQAKNTYNWVLVDVHEYDIPAKLQEEGQIGKIDTGARRIEVKKSLPYGLGPYSSRDYDNPMNLHAVYNWTDFPSQVAADQTVSIDFSQTALSNRTGNFGVRFRPYIKIDEPDLQIGYGTAGGYGGNLIYADGTEATGTGTIRAGIGYYNDDQAQGNYTGDMIIEFPGQAAPGTKKALYFGIYVGAEGSIGARYTYEWKQTSSSSSVFVDLDSHWSKEYVEGLYSRGIVNGKQRPDGSFIFDPNGKITRQEFAKLIVESEGLEPRLTSDINDFTDASSIDSWAKPYVATAYRAGLIAGSSDSYGNLRFNPKASINRAEIATIIGRTLGQQVSGRTSFVDDAGIPSWAKGYVKLCADRGIITGDQNNRFNATNSASRAESATMIYRLIMN